ncbi:MAG: hypothetical protein GXY13_12330, partial [Acidimicrobiales bacterium]|nr:hypothetical protein [Acidimicrobiales bacterium]
ARDHLVVTCTSRDIRTNEEVPRAAMLEELVAVVATTAGVDPAAVVVDHPRQGFDPRNFRPGDPFSFDPLGASGARSVLRRGTEPGGGAIRPLVAAPLPPAPDGGVVLLDDLIGFFAHPVRAFFGQRLDVTLPKETEAGDDQLPTGLDGLQLSGLGAELLVVGRRLDDLAGLTPDRHGRYAREIEDLFRLHEASGILPPGPVGRGLLGELAADVTRLLEWGDRLGVRRIEEVVHPVDVLLDDGTRLLGQVGGCVATGDHPGPVRLRYARHRPNHELRATIALLAAAAAEPASASAFVLVTRGDSGSKPPVVKRGIVAAGTDDDRRRVARGALTDLVAQRRDGLRAPLPLFDRTSKAVIDGRSTPDRQWGDPDDAGPAFAKEALDAHHRMAFGTVTYPDLVAADLAGHRLEHEARRLWLGLQAAVPTEDLAGSGSTRRKRG